MIPSVLLVLIDKYNEKGQFINDNKFIYWFNGKKFIKWCAVPIEIFEIIPHQYYLLLYYGNDYWTYNGTKFIKANFTFILYPQKMSHLKYKEYIQYNNDIWAYIIDGIAFKIIKMMKYKHKLYFFHLIDNGHHLIFDLIQKNWSSYIESDRICYSNICLIDGLFYFFHIYNSDITIYNAITNEWILEKNQLVSPLVIKKIL